MGSVDEEEHEDDTENAGAPGGLDLRGSLGPTDLMINEFQDAGWHVKTRRGKGIGSLMAVDKRGKEHGYEVINITSDSGAAGMVGPANVAEAFKVHDNNASRKKRYYIAATGSKLCNEGEKHIPRVLRRRSATQRGNAGGRCPQGIGISRLNV